MQHNVQTGKLQHSEKHFVQLSIVRLSVTVLSVAMLVFVVLNVVLFNVVAPLSAAQDSSFK